MYFLIGDGMVRPTGSGRAGLVQVLALAGPSAHVRRLGWMIIHWIQNGPVRSGTTKPASLRRTGDAAGDCGHRTAATARAVAAEGTHCYGDMISGGIVGAGGPGLSVIWPRGD